MKIDFDMDSKELQERFELSEKNLAYATVNAINKTAMQVQAQAKDNLRRKFVLRSDFLLSQAAIIKPFASVKKGVLSAEVAVGQKPRLLLADFEAGAQRVPFVGSRVAVPITGSAARPSFQSKVPSDMRISALGLTPPNRWSKEQRSAFKAIKGTNRNETRRLKMDFKKANSGGGAWTGRQRTYMITGIGIFQRTASGHRSGTSMIYKFVPAPMIKARLGFLAMAQEQGQAWLKDNLDDAIKGELNRKRR